MKQEADNLASTLASEDDRSEPTSPEFVEDKDNEGVDHSGHEPSDEGEDEGPIDLRKKPSSEKARTVGSGSTNVNGGHGHRPEAATPASTETILDIFQRTLMTAGLPPYLSPLLFLGGAAASDDLAKAMAERVLPPDQIPYPYRTLLPNVDFMGGQTPVVRDPYGRRHILVQSPDGNVVTIPLSSDNVLSEYEKSVGGGSKTTAFKKRDYYAQKEREEEDAYVERSRYRLTGVPPVREKDVYPPKRDGYSSVRQKSELVSRLESAPVMSQSDYLSSERRGGLRRTESSRTSVNRDSEPEDLSLAGSDASNEDERGQTAREWDAFSHRGRWGQPAPEEEEDQLEEEARRRFFRSRSCSDLLKFKTMEERERAKAADNLTPASLSCPSLAATSSSMMASRWRDSEPSDHHRHRNKNHHIHHHRKRKFVTHHDERQDEEDEVEDMVVDYDPLNENHDESGGRQQPEIVNAPITRLFNPKKNAAATRPKLPRLLKSEDHLMDNVRLREMRESGYTERSDHLSLHHHRRMGTPRYNEDEEDEEVLRESIRQQTRLASEMTPDGSRMTPEQEETFLERLRHSAPVPWNVYSYYTQMMRNLTEPRNHHRESVYHNEDKRPSSNVSSSSPQHRSLHNNQHHQTVTSSYQPPRSPDTTNASPPNSLLVAAIASGIGNGNGNGVQNALVPPGSPSLPDSRKAARVLTGKHVRQGTGASPATLLTLRQKIQERQRAKEMSSQTTTHFGRSTSNAKVGRDLKRKNQLPPSIPLVNKSR